MGLWKTVNDGERVAVWSKNGSVKMLDGPKRIFTMSKRVEKLQQSFADHTEYLSVTFVDGRINIIPGPVSLFRDPVKHKSIVSKSAILVDASEALVVYKNATVEPKSPKSSLMSLNDIVPATVVRRIVRGPARFVPAADEWIHNFAWSGHVDSKTSYQPKALKFTHLRTVPSSAYHNVTEVRTNDDTLITVKLMLFYNLVDIESMLDATNDPIGEFINAASADVIAFCSSISYESFLNETHRLNDLATFSQLCVRAKSIGYEINKVVFRGFQAGAKLQAMHDDAIQERTRLRLLEETQAQEQRAADLDLHAKQKRAAQQAELSTKEAEQRAELSMLAQRSKIAERQMMEEADVAREKTKHQAMIEQEKATQEAALTYEQRKIDLLKARNAEQLEMMRSMHTLGVDLTKVLVSQHEQPDRVIKLDTGGAGGGGGNASAGKAGSGRGLFGALQLNLE